MNKKEMAKQIRGAMDYRYDSGNKIVVIRWDDNTQVTVASNVHVVNPVLKCKRYSRGEHKQIEIDTPSMIRNLELDGCPSKENLFGQSTLLMNATYIVFPWSDL